MGSLAEDLLVLAVMAENAGVQSARRMPYVLRGDEQQAMRAAMKPVMRSALYWSNDPAALVTLNSLTHTPGPDVSHHPPGGHGHGGGHHG